MYKLIKILVIGVFSIQPSFQERFIAFNCCNGAMDEIAELSASIAQLNAKIAAQDDKITAIEGINTAQDGKITSVESVNSAQDAKIWALESKNSDQDERLTALEDKNSEQDGTISSQQSAIIDLDARVRILENAAQTGIFPLNYVYIQYTSDSDPNLIYPQYAWIEITSQFDGAFFRADGARDFEVQELASSPLIKGLILEGANVVPHYPLHYELDNGENRIIIGEIYSPAYAGGPISSTNVTLIAEGYGVTIRPLNYPIRIWKRSG